MRNTAWGPMADIRGVQKQGTVFGKKAVVVGVRRQVLAAFRTKLEERKRHQGLEMQ